MRRVKVCESTSSMSCHLGRFAVSYQGLISQMSTSLVNGRFKFFPIDGYDIPVHDIPVED